MYACEYECGPDQRRKKERRKWWRGLIMFGGEVGVAVSRTHYVVRVFYYECT